MNDTKPKTFFRSRSIDSITGSDQISESIPTVEEPATASPSVQDEKPQNTGTFTKTLRTLRSRWSRQSNCSKSESTSQNEKNNRSKSICEDTGGSSGGEETSSVSITDTTTTTTHIEPSSSVPQKPLGTSVSLRVHRSFPSEKRTTGGGRPSSDSTDSTDKNNDSGSGSEISNLSKTWTSSTFSHTQLRGTCSLEYVEHMREKSHKRKAHMVDLRKDDANHQQANTTTSSSKNLISTSLTSSTNHALTLMNNKGARSHNFLLIYFIHTRLTMSMISLLC